eukprot:scaffold90055_cov42-Phaeocystis_antarctica.AAC.2
MWSCDTPAKAAEGIDLGGDGVGCGNGRAMWAISLTTTIIQVQAARRRAGGIARSKAHPCEEALELSQGDADTRPNLDPLLHGQNLSP